MFALTERLSGQTKMAIETKYYEFTLTGGNRRIKLPEYYDDINTQLGITASSDTSTTPRGNAEELYTDGLLSKVVLSVKRGSGYRRTTVYCASNTVSVAMGNLEGKSFGTGLKGGKLKILNAYFPRRRKYRY